MRRARSDEDKQERRRAILDVAMAAYEENPSFAAFTMSALAERCGLAKGTMYLYFRSKEEVFLALIDERFDAWFDEIDAGLDEDGGAWTGARAVEVLMRTTRRHTTLARLLSILGSVVEHNVPFEAALAFKRKTYARVAATGERLERRLPFLAPGAGTRLLVWLHGLVIGFWQLHEPSETIRRIMQQPEFARGRVDFDRDLGALLGTLMRGMEAEADGG